MKNVMDQLADSWYTLLNGNLSYDSREVKVYSEDADSADKFHYVVIKAESETDDSNKTSFVKNPVIIIDIITVHSITGVRKSIVNDIDDQIGELLFPTRKCALPALDGLQITNVRPEGSTYLNEDDGTKKYYRKVTRYVHRVTQIN